MICAALLFCAAVAAVAAETAPDPPGVSVVLTQKGLDFISRWAWEEFGKFLATDAREVKIDVGRLDLTDSYAINVEKLYVRKYGPKYDSSIRTLPGFGLEWRVRGVALDMLGTFRSVAGERRVKTGKVRLKVNRLLLQIILGTERGSNSLGSAWDGCKIISALGDEFAVGFCAALKEKLWPAMQERLFSQTDFKPLVKRTSDWDFSHDLTPLPGRLEFHSSGQVSCLYAGRVEVGNDDTHIATPLNDPEGTWPTPPTNPRDSGKMMKIYMSPIVLASFSARIQDSGQYGVSFKPNDDVEQPEFAKYLVTSCDGVCAGTFFPALEAKYPNSRLSVETVLLGRGFDVKLSPPTDVLYRGLFRLRIWIVQPDADEDVDFVTSYFNVMSTIQSPQVVVDKDGLIRMTSDLDILGHDIINATSTIPDISTDDIGFMIGLVVDSVVRDKFRDNFRPGMPLPALLRFPLLAPRLRVEDEFVVLETDLCLPAECERLRALLPTTTTPKPDPDDLSQYDYTY